MRAKDGPNVIPRPEPKVKRPADASRPFEQTVRPDPDVRCYKFRDPPGTSNRRVIEFRLYAAPSKDLERRKKLLQMLYDEKRSGCKFVGFV